MNGNPSISFTISDSTAFFCIFNCKTHQMFNFMCMWRREGVQVRRSKKLQHDDTFSLSRLDHRVRVISNSSLVNNHKRKVSDINYKKNSNLPPPIFIWASQGCLNLLSCLLGCSVDSVLATKFSVQLPYVLIQFSGEIRSQCDWWLLSAALDCISTTDQS